MKIFICTAGTSIVTNKKIDINPIENKPLSEKSDLKLYILGLEQQVEDYFTKIDPLKDLDQTSAEIKSLAKMGVAKGDKVHLLVSDTVDGEVCAQMNKNYLEENWHCHVIMENIAGLQPLQSQLFRKEGLKNFLTKLIYLLEKYRNDDLILNATAGYKSVIPYLTLLGMIHDRPIKYIYEKSDEVISLERIPVTYDEYLILEVEDKLALIEKESEIKLELWQQGIPFEKRGRYDSLVEESRVGYVTISAIGLIFYEKFKTDYPSELEKDHTPPDKKTIGLRDDHGKDILMAFSQRLIKSPYVRKIINSMPFNPKQKDPIKEFYEDGRVEIVLTNTDQGYGLIVQTTGKDLKQTRRIADLLKEKYLK